MRRTRESVLDTKLCHWAMGGRNKTTESKNYALTHMNVCTALNKVAKPLASTMSFGSLMSALIPVWYLRTLCQNTSRLCFLAGTRRFNKNKRPYMYWVISSTFEVCALGLAQHVPAVRTSDFREISCYSGQTVGFQSGDISKRSVCERPICPPRQGYIVVAVELTGCRPPWV